MKDENTQVPDTFDEQEELRSEKRGLRLYFSGLVCCLIAFGFIIAGIFFQKYNVKNGDAIAIGGFVTVSYTHLAIFWSYSVISVNSTILFSRFFR